MSTPSSTSQVQCQRERADGPHKPFVSACTSSARLSSARPSVDGIPYRSGDYVGGACSASSRICRTAPCHERYTPLNRLALTPGTRLGPYEIRSPLGAGGMGEVYRAHDGKLNRDVALKILPAAFADDPERLARFTREAQTLAALNHPNIAHIHGLEENGGVRTLVMELVEGEDLSQRIARGPIPLDDALAIARQIAEALEAAHEQGIIHRDLKPANIKLRADDVVKVLDFGLAKALEPGSGSGDGGSPNLANSPTITSPAMTMRGMILGTAAYMAPEQAKGKPVDRRADIWAFGCVLYEMLASRRAFEGDDISTTLAAVLLKDPEWGALPASTSVALRRLLTRCLTKDPKARLRDIGEARIRIDELLGSAPDEAGAPVVTPAVSRWRRVVPWAAAGVLALGSMLIGAVVARRSDGDMTSKAVPVTFAVAPPENTSFGGPPGGGTGTATQVAVSPDGRNIAFVAGAQAAYQIYLRPVASLAARAIPGTDGGTFPFWSPDSRFIGFFAGGKLKRAPIAGGPAVVLCDAPFGRGGSWSRDNVILFAPGEVANAPGRETLWRVSSAGGLPAVVTRINPANADTRHRWPHFLPDGRHFFYTEVFGAPGTGAKPSTIRIGSLEPGEADVMLLQAESSAAYASGHLLFARDETLMAQPFNPDARQSMAKPSRWPSASARREAATWARQCRRMACSCMAATTPSLSPSRRGGIARVVPSARWVDLRGTSTWRCHPMNAAWRSPWAP